MTNTLKVKRIAKLLPTKKNRPPLEATSRSDRGLLMGDSVGKFRKKTLENKFFASFSLPAIPAFLSGFTF